MVTLWVPLGDSRRHYWNAEYPCGECRVGRNAYDRERFRDKQTAVRVSVKDFMA